MKVLRLFLFAALLMAFQCEDEVNVQEDLLFESGIYGGWELASQTVNGVTDMMPLPEMILEFYPDGNTQDNRGEYNLEEPFANTVGVFIMDQIEQTIAFKREGKEDIVYGYIIHPDKDFITFTFVESNAQFEQGWRKKY
jgi:hypothetical protein